MRKAVDMKNYLLKLKKSGHGIILLAGNQLLAGNIQRHSHGGDSHDHGGDHGIGARQLGSGCSSEGSLGEALFMCV